MGAFFSVDEYSSHRFKEIVKGFLKILCLTEDVYRLEIPFKDFHEEVNVAARKSEYSSWVLD